MLIRYFVLIFLFLSSRLEDEAQKRADAESNLIAFRKVNTHHCHIGMTKQIFTTHVGQILYYYPFI